MSERYIFGAGIQGEIFFQSFQFSSITLDGFIDAYSQQTHLYDMPIIRQEDIENKDAEIYISVGLLSRRIKSELVAQGFTRVYDFTESIFACPAIIQQLIPYSLWYSAVIDEMVELEQLAKVRGLLFDDKSRQLLDQIVRFRQHNRVEDYPIPDPHIQYFAEDIPVFNHLSALRFIDAGAYNGDTLTSLFTAAQLHALPVEYCASFEPDPSNLYKLNCRVKALGAEHHGRVFIYPAGVWSKCCLLAFNAEHSTSSRLTGTMGSQDNLVSCVALDDVVFGGSPNFIKMDIEGAEKAALLGAKNIIQTYRPVLAICLYHNPSDLWDIPLMINDMVPDYDMYIRVYGDMLLETVLYCIPKKRSENVGPDKE